MDPSAKTFNDFYFGLLSENSPQHLISFWLAQQLNAEWRADLGLRYSSEYGYEGNDVQDAIFQMDLGLTWEPNDALRLSLIGRNLLDSQTDDTLLKDYGGSTKEIEREWYLEIAYSF